MIYYNRKLKHIARTLRKNMTESERLLWSKLRRKQLKDCQFYRQKVVGNYIVDFYCPSARIIVEVDGSQHYEEAAIKKDKIRDAYLNKTGFAVLRFSSVDVFKNLDGVLEEIYDHLYPKESPSGPPFGKRGKVRSLEWR